MTALFTFGHGAAELDAIAELIAKNELALVADVRSVPKSRKHPQFGMDEMRTWVPARTNARYAWMQQLGGFRKVRPDSDNLALRHPSFRGYADYMQTPAFADALDDLLHDADEARTAIMCSETLWWRCHRRLISDAAVLLHDVAVTHLFAKAKPRPHELTPGVRKAGSILIYDDMPTAQAADGT
jgi:uncharacterized protein (DUF488 family)